MIDQVIVKNLRLGQSLHSIYQNIKNTVCVILKKNNTQIMQIF